VAGVGGVDQVEQDRGGLLLQAVGDVEAVDDVGVGQRPGWGGGALERGGFEVFQHFQHPTIFEQVYDIFGRRVEAAKVSDPGGTLPDMTDQPSTNASTTELPGRRFDLVHTPVIRALTTAERRRCGSWAAAGMRSRSALILSATVAATSCRTSPVPSAELGDNHVADVVGRAARGGVQFAPGTGPVEAGHGGQAGQRFVAASRPSPAHLTG
jgi:hypothetical protein